jgi:hypothetical protein
VGCLDPKRQAIREVDLVSEGNNILRIVVLLGHMKLLSFSVCPIVLALQSKSQICEHGLFGAGPLTPF